MRDRKNFCSTI
jgi:hypothetical protein